jgi:hypothetical protein
MAEERGKAIEGLLQALGIAFMGLLVCKGGPNGIVLMFNAIMA